jgi:plasmid stabilization system protein ParE
MSKFRLTPAAINDIFEIWVYIAANNSVSADRLENDIFAACEKLSQWPKIGHQRRDLTDKPLLFFPVRGTYLIVYDAAASPISIVRVLHGSRNAKAELRKPDAK